MLTKVIDLCEPGLVCWLVEELLDSQTIDGCRKVFDYLDSRRERMIAVCGIALRQISRVADNGAAETFQIKATYHTQSMQ